MKHLDDAIAKIDGALEELEKAKKKLPFGIENHWLYLAPSQIKKQREKINHKAEFIRAKERSDEIERKSL